MAVYTLEQYRRVMRERANRISKINKVTPVQAAKYMANTARAMAPHKTGRLRRGIVQTKNVVTGRASRNGFPYIHWLNQTVGADLDVLKIRRNRAGQFMSRYEKVEPWRIEFWRYGATTKNTGKPQFFWLATQRAAKHFRHLNVVYMNKTLQVK